MEGSCRRSVVYALEQSGQNTQSCLSNDPCTECGYFPIYPCWSSTQPMVHCIMSYTNDFLVWSGPPMYDALVAEGHDARLLTFSPNEGQSIPGGHTETQNHPDWVVGCLGITPVCSASCAISFGECVGLSSKSEDTMKFADCIGSASFSTLTGCTAGCAPTQAMLESSEMPATTLSAGRFGSDASTGPATRTGTSKCVHTSTTGESTAALPSKSPTTAAPIASPTISLGVVNPSFESGGGWTGLKRGSTDLFAPPGGKHYAAHTPGAEAIEQTFSELYQAGRTYKVTVYARSIDEAAAALLPDGLTSGVHKEVTAEISLLADGSPVKVSSETVSPMALKGAHDPTDPKAANDDGGNVWIDGNYRMQIGGMLTYQELSSDPISDPWLLSKRETWDGSAKAPIVLPSGSKAIYYNEGIGDPTDGGDHFAMISRRVAVGDPPHYDFEKGDVLDNGVSLAKGCTFEACQRTTDSVLYQAGDQRPWYASRRLRGDGVVWRVCWGA